MSNADIDYEKSLIEYIRDDNEQRIGMLMAAIDRETNQVRIGWSLTRSNSDDVFNKDRAFTIAIGRIELADVHKVTIPFAIAETGILEKFVLRCMKYYRSNNVQIFGRVRKDMDTIGKLHYEEFAIS